MILLTSLLLSELKITPTLRVNVFHIYTIVTFAFILRNTGRTALLKCHGVARATPPLHAKDPDKGISRSFTLFLLAFLHFPLFGLFFEAQLGPWRFLVDDYWSLGWDIVGVEKSNMVALVRRFFRTASRAWRRWIFLVLYSLLLFHLYLFLSFKMVVLHRTDHVDNILVHLIQCPVEISLLL